MPLELTPRECDLLSLLIRRARYPVCEIGILEHLLDLRRGFRIRLERIYDRR